jgi:hypothetical protein
MKTCLIAALLIMGLTACTAPTLEERLAGKTGEDRETELHNACIQRANYPTPGGHDASYVGHEGRMWAICDAMHATNTNEEK